MQNTMRKHSRIIEKKNETYNSWKIENHSRTLNELLDSNSENELNSKNLFCISFLDMINCWNDWLIWLIWIVTMSLKLSKNDKWWRWSWKKKIFTFNFSLLCVASNHYDSDNKRKHITRQRMNIMNVLFAIIVINLMNLKFNHDLSSLWNYNFVWSWLDLFQIWFSRRRFD